MAGKVVWFTRGDGERFCCNEDTAAYDRMFEDGAFTMDGEDEPAEAGTQNDSVDLSKMNRTQLIEEAAKHGITIDAADKSQTKAVIVLAIEAAHAAAAAESGESEEESSDEE